MRNVMTLQQGDTVNLGGTEFWVVKAVEGFGVKIIDKTSINTSFSQNGTTNKLPNSTVLNRLNTYYNNLSEGVKNFLVQDVTWYIGDERNIQANTMVGPIGLLNLNEFKECISFRGGKIPVLPNHAYEWSCTPYYGAIGGNRYVWTVMSSYEDISNISGETTREARPALVLKSTLMVSDTGEVTDNFPPTITLSSPTQNQTLYENSTLTLAGNTADIDIDNVVTIKYQIDSGAVRNLHSAVSDGVTAIDFLKALTYKDGMLFDGATAVTGVLDKDMPHIVSIWAEDDKGGKSSVITRSFFVVPNRPPTLTINPIAAQSELINSNVINVDGAVSDLDGNDVTVTFSINGAEEQRVYQGPPAAFAFNLLLNDLRVGTNTVLVKATDTYNFQTTKTLTITKTHDAVPINEAVALYKITAPTGSAKSILLWITRTLGAMNITAEISLTNDGEAENFAPLTKTNSAVVNGLRQDEFAYQGDVEKTNIVLKITYDRTDAASVDVIKQISGVLF